MYVCGIPWTLWDPSDLLSLWDLFWDSSGIHETCVGPHVTRDTHVGLVAHGWLDSLVFSLACSSTGDFELHRRADVRAFVLGRGRRDDGAVGVGGRGGFCINADDILSKT